jgi:hypothetical protein
VLALALAVAAAAIAPPPANARFDYQIGEPYKPPRGVRVVSRDWFDAKPPKRGYAICYVNAFQTQDDSPDVVRPDERSAWPADLVLSSLGDDPNWGGEYLVDISTAAKRRRAADWLQPMIETCKRKGYDAVEYDNLDSWTRFDGTPREGDVPFGKPSALAFAALITRRAHALGLAVGQKNTAELTRRQARVYGNHVIAIEYRRRDFRYTCRTVGDRISVVLRDVDVTAPGSRTYRYDSC